MADEDEQWLYGDSNLEPPGTEGTLPGLEPISTPQGVQDAAGSTNGTVEPGPPGEEGEDSPKDEEMKDGDGPEEAEVAAEDEEGADENGGVEEGEEEKDDDDDDSDDDNVNVVIGDISKAAPTYTNLNVHKRGGLVPAAKGIGSKFSIEEFESIGVINGMSAIEYNLDVLEEKPWRKPGADITDYFNYGFNEETWKAYCDRQKRIRINDSGVGIPSNVQASQMHSGSMSQPPPLPASNSQSMAQPKRFEPSGQIHVVGGNIASRRLDQPNPSPLHLPPMGMPPPGFPPMQPQFQPPPQQFFPPPGPDYSDNYQQQWRTDFRQPNNLITPGLNMPPSKREDFDDDYERERYSERDDRGRDRDNERDDRHRERDERDRDRERDREDRDRRDRYRRSRSRSHGRERSRMRSRSRSPHKKHKKKSKKTDKEKSDKKKRSDDSE